MRPVGLACCDIKAVKEAAEVGHKEQPIFDCNGAARAVHRLFKVQFSVGISVEARVVPDRCRIGIGPGNFALLFDHGLVAAMGQGGGRVFEADSQFGARVASFCWVDTPKVPHSLAVLGVLANSDIDKPFVDHRRANDVIAIGSAAERVFRLLGIAVKLPEQLGPSGADSRRFSFALRIESLASGIK